MSSFEDGLKKGEWNPDKEDNGWLLPLTKSYPTLAKALRGTDRERGDAEDRPGLTLMLFSRDGMLKFSLSSQDWPRTYYGQVSDASEPLMSVELALVANQGEWSVKRQKNDRRSSF